METDVVSLLPRDNRPATDLAKEVAVQKSKSRKQKSPLQSHVEERPELNSFDSGNECSLDHWLEVYWLVEEDFAFAKSGDEEISMMRYREVEAIH